MTALECSSSAPSGTTRLRCPRRSSTGIAQHAVVVRPGGQLSGEAEPNDTEQTARRVLCGPCSIGMPVIVGRPMTRW
jgi:hypothetical protein